MIAVLANESPIESIVEDVIPWMARILTSQEFLVSFTGMAVITVTVMGGLIRKASRSLSLSMARARRVE